MNNTLKAVVIEVSGGNVRNHHINLRGAFGLFPDSALGGNNDSSAGQPVKVTFGAETVETDIDKTKAIFRERSAIRRFFEIEQIVQGDLLLVERLSSGTFEVRKASKRGFNIYL